MIIGEVKGDLVDMLESAINSGARFIGAQGCNMQCKQGSGIAGQLRRIPAVFEADVKATEVGIVSPDRPSIATWNAGETAFFNLYTQPTPGPTANLDFVRRSIDGLHKRMIKADRGNDIVFIPLIGCGIGGLDWLDVRKILEESGVRFIVVHWEG